MHLYLVWKMDWLLAILKFILAALIGGGLLIYAWYKVGNWIRRIFR